VPDDLGVTVWLFRSLIRAMNLKFWKRLDEKKKLRRTRWPKRTDIERRKWLKNLIMNWKLSICWQQAVKLKSGGRANWNMRDLNQHISQMTVQSNKSRPAFTAIRYLQLQKQTSKRRFEEIKMKMDRLKCMIFLRNWKTEELNTKWLERFHELPNFLDFVTFWNRKMRI